MKKSLIKGLVFAFLGVLLFTASTHIIDLNTIILKYSYIIIAMGIILFVYAAKVSESTKPILHTTAGILIFRGLVSVPYITNTIAQYPLIIIMGIFLFFVFHDRIFEIFRLE